MSLDVSLFRKKLVSYDEFKTVEKQNELVYSDNITHNLNIMADKAGIYEALWQPHRLHDNYLKSYSENNDAKYEFKNSISILAKDIIMPLQKSYDRLISEQSYFEQFNSDNGWGLYKDFVPFVKNYLDACIKFPNSIIFVSR